MSAHRLIGVAATAVVVGIGGIVAIGNGAAADEPSADSLEPSESASPPGPTIPPDSIDPSDDILPLEGSSDLPQTPVTAVECSLSDAAVEAGTATFTVGPEGCAGEVGPISFSTFLLPNGVRMPYDEQVPIAHAAGNGGFFGAGAHVLSATLGDAECWQSDLYFGVSAMPPFPNLIAYDYHECQPAPTTTAPPTTTNVPPSEGVECSLSDAVVEAGAATFTVGPEGCTGEVGPISFSTFVLPSGIRVPYDEQVLIEHAAGNGGFYGAGTHVLSATLGDAECWQSDLYFGPSAMPPFRYLVAYDYHECRTTPTTSAPTTVAPTTAPAVAGDTGSLAPPATVVSTGPTVPLGTGVATPAPTTTTPQVASAGPVASAGQTTTVAPENQSLPQTGQSSTLVLVVGAVGVTLVGLLARRLTRRSIA